MFTAIAYMITAFYLNMYWNKPVDAVVAAIGVGVVSLVIILR